MDYSITTEQVKEICDAIRTRSQTTSTYKFNQIPSAILTIPGGSGGAIPYEKILENGQVEQASPGKYLSVSTEKSPLDYDYLGIKMWNAAYPNDLYESIIQAPKTTDPIISVKGPQSGNLWQFRLFNDRIDCIYSPGSYINCFLSMYGYKVKFDDSWK